MGEQNIASKLYLPPLIIFETEYPEVNRLMCNLIHVTTALFLPGQTG
jgi:hypothetical protein